MLFFDCGERHGDDVALLWRDGNLTPDEAFCVAHRYKIEKLAKRGFIWPGKKAPYMGIRCVRLKSKERQ